jgi:hypothetical protein
MHSFKLFHNYERSDWHIRDLPWDQLRPDLVQPRDRILARIGMIGGSSAIAAMHTLLNESAADYDFAAFTMLWGIRNSDITACIVLGWNRSVIGSTHARSRRCVQPFHRVGRTRPPSPPTSFRS